MGTHMTILRLHQARFVRSHQSGVSLIIVLIMLVVIGLTSANAIRKATSGERATNNIRMQNLALQYAEAALRYCETEVAKTSAIRAQNSLKDGAIFNDNPAAPGTALNDNFPADGWNKPATWTSVGGALTAAASKTEVPSAQVTSTSGSSAFTPSKLPQCVIERSKLPDGNTATVITARGFSPDYENAGAVTEATTRGSVVWLQSTSFFN